MAEPYLLYVVGAAKAGTSWLYRYLHGHPGCALKSVKEMHYFDTFDAEAREKQLVAFERHLQNFRRAQEEAAAAKRSWQVENMERRIRDMEGLLSVIAGDRTGDAAYRAYLTAGAEGRLVADMTPGYALQDADRFRQMAAVSPGARFLYLIRDPVERIWSHVRMQAKNYLQPGEEISVKARRILNRTVKKGMETHIPARGDYRGTIERLRAAVPAGRLLVEFMEVMLTPAGLERICAFLGIAARPPETADKVHAGEEVPLNENQRRNTARFLKDQYDWVAANVGPLPEAWQANYERAAA